jgi:hypothetical protein
VVNRFAEAAESVPFQDILANDGGEDPAKGHVPALAFQQDHGIFSAKGEEQLIM